MQTFDEWYTENEDEIMIELAESGADREMDFSFEDAVEERYEKYIKAQEKKESRQYELYLKYACNLEEPDFAIHLEDIDKNVVRVMTEEEFRLRLKGDSSFRQIHRGTVKLMS